MAFDVIMPKMGESISEGTILQWLKKEGDKVERDEIILEISTDKVDSEIPAPSSGILSKIIAQEGDTVEVGAKIAELLSEGETGAATETKKEVVESKTTGVEKDAAAVPYTPPKPAAEEETVPDSDARFYSPLVKSIAKEEDISQAELARIPGSGQGGRVNKSDILAYLKSRTAAMASTQPAPAPAAVAPTSPPAASTPPITSTPSGTDEIVEMDNMRRLIADHMVRSVKTSPHVYSVSEADVTHLVKYRECVKDEFLRKEGVKLTYTAFFIYAAAKALREFPYLNSSVEGTRITLKSNINIGTAVAIESGLIVPVVKNADALNLVGIARALSDLSTRARNKKLVPDEVQGGTFTLTNVGTFGNLYGTPIINQPQVAILGIGAIKKRVAVINDAIGIRDMMYLSLGYDHRIIDGAMGGNFLQRIVQNLESMDPSQL